MMYKIGHSVDTHKLVKDRKLILGGVEIKHNKGLAGHSDADVLTHAITEAIIGALGIGDLGTHFPDNDNKYKGINSLELLEIIYNKMNDTGFKIGNIDATILAEKPKLKLHTNSMKSNIARILRCRETDVNIKATTGEGIGYIGREEGITAHCVVIIAKKMNAVNL